MAKNSRDAYAGVLGESRVLMFDPEQLTLVIDKESPLYDPRVNDPVSPEMVANVKAFGVLQPIVVCKNPESGATEVVAGRQRVKACREANKLIAAEGGLQHRVPGIVRKGKPADMAAVMVIENEIRRDDTPLRKAEKMARLQTYNLGEDEIAIIFGCNKQTVTNTLRLLEQPAAVQKAVESGQITVTTAGKLAKFEPGEQREKLAEILAESTGKKGHKKAKAVAAVVDAKPKMRTRKEINAMLPRVNGEAAAVLDWVMGDTDESFARPIPADLKE